MSTLHTVNKSPFSNQSLLSSLSHARHGDAILLIEDAVYGFLAGTSLSKVVKVLRKRAGEGLKLYVLEPDLKARGIDPSRLMEGVTLLDYSGFVNLAAEHDRTQAWL